MADQDQTERELWDRATSLRPEGFRFQLGDVLGRIRELYSERERRKNGGPSAGVVGHGQFETECLRRGFSPRTVRDIIRDYEIQIARGSTKPGPKAQEKTSSEKRRESRQRTGAHRPHRFGLDADYVAFARLLPYSAAKIAFREAAIRLHPDHAGDAEAMKRLNILWERLEPIYMAADGMPMPGFGNSTQETVQ
jgi:hypothetical protein